MLVDRQEVPGSPFHFVASLSPTELGQPVKKWNQIYGAHDITTNSTGEFLIAEKCGDIVKVEQNGNRQTLVEYFSHGLNSLRGIAADSDGNIYCTDVKSSQILKCDKNGRNIQVHHIEQDEGEGHRGVVIVDEEQLACAAEVCGTILVYDRNLQYAREIQHNGGGEFYDISADSLHNLYVADFSNDIIHVFGIDGTHLHSVNIYCHEDISMCGPNSVHVFQQHLCICNSSHNISVFNTDDTHVNTFGSCGSEVGQLDSHTVGEDSLVYVAEYNNDRIQCF